MPVFRPGIVGTFTRGTDAVLLSGVLAKVLEAYPVRLALGDPFNRARRASALSLLENLPPRTQERIAAAYEAKRGEELNRDARD